MAERAVFVSIRLKDAEQAIAGLRKLGKDGEAAIGVLERSIKPANQGLLTIDKSSKGLQLSFRNLATSAALVEGPLGGVAGRLGAISAAFGRVNPAIAAGLVGIGGFTIGLTKAVRAGSTYEQFLLRTQRQLIATGNASGLTVRQIDRFSVALAKNTLASTEGARRAAAALLTFRSVSGDTFKETLRLAQDLAATGFGTLESNAVQLGKALEDPTLGLTALRRVGVSFSDQQREMIKAMTEAGDVAGAQAVILGGLRGQVAGSGEAEAGGLAGAFDTLTENIGRFFEKLGTETGLLTRLAAGISGLAGVVDDANEALFKTPADRLAALRAQLAELRGEEEGSGTISRPRGIRPSGASGATAEPGADPLAGTRRRPSARGVVSREEAILKAFKAEERLLTLQKQAQRETERSADFQARTRAEESRAAKEKEEADKRAKQAAKDAAAEQRKQASERKRALSEIASLEERAARAGLKGIELLAVQRDQEVEKHRKRLDAQTIVQEEFNRARLALEEDFQKRKAAIEAAEEEKRQKKRDAAAKKEAERIKREAEKQAELLRKPFEDAAESLRDHMADRLFGFLDDGKLKVSDFLDFMQDSFKRTVAEIAATIAQQQIFAPVISGVTQGLGLGALSSAPPGGGVFGGGGLFGSLFGGSGLPAPGTVAGTTPGTGGPLSAVGAFLSQPLFGGNAFGASGLGGTAASSLPALSSASGAVPLSLGGALTAGGLGFLGGGILQQFLGGNQLGGQIGGGLGAAAGAAIGSVIPGVGTVIGGLAGGALGSVVGGLFGGGDPKPHARANVRLVDGQLTIADVDADDGGDARKVQQVAANTIGALNSFAAALGTSVGDLNKIKIREEKGRFDITAFLADGTKAGSRAKGIAGASDAALALAFENLSFEGLDSKLQDIATRSAQIGGGIEQVLKDVELAAGIFDAALPAEDLTETERALKALGDEFETFRGRAQQLGLSMGDINQAERDAEAQLRSGFERGIELQILAITDPLRASFAALADAQADRLREAETIGANLAEIRKLNALESGQLQNRPGGLGAFISGLKTGPLSPLSAGDRFRSAERDFISARSSGNVTDFIASSNAFLSESRNLFGSGAGFSESFDRVLAAAEQIAVGQTDSLAAAGVEAQQATSAGVAKLIEEIQGLRADLKRSSRAPARVAQAA